MPAKISTHMHEIFISLLPWLIGVGLLLLSLMPIPVSGLQTVMPPLALMAVVYFAIYRPDLFGLGSAFTLGLLQDFLLGAPLGISAFLFCAVRHYLAARQRFFQKGSFWQLWVAFAVAQLVTSLGQYAAWSYLAGAAYAIIPFMVQGVLALALFPLLHWALNRLQHHALRTD